jgi:hypothetical protein
MSGSVLLYRQRSPEDLQQVIAWYKIRDTLFGNWLKQNIKEALGLTSICEHPNAVWLTKLFGGREIAAREEARQVFLDCESDPRALCFAGLLGGDDDEIRRAVDLGDAFAQAWMAKPGYVVKIVFGGRRNLLHKENAMVSTTLGIAIGMELGARKTRKKQKRTF